MRIVIIGPAHPFRGGIADTDESLCRALMEEGHDTSIMTFTKQYPAVLFPGKTQYSESAAPDDLTIIREIHSYNPFSWKGSARRILELAPDLVVFRFWTPFIGLVYKALAKRLKGKAKLIAMVDNASPHEGSLFDKLLAGGFLSRVEGVMCLSQYVENRVKEMVDVPVSSYPHPINTDLGKKEERLRAIGHLGLDPDKRYLLFFGLVRKYKGLDILLESLAVVKDRLPDLQLIIAGEFYEPKKGYLQMIERLGLEDRVHIHDRFIPKAEVTAYFSAVELLTLTYRSATQSGVTQMAMHFDLPTLVTDVGALSEYVDHENTGFVLPKDSAQIGETIAGYIENDRFEEMRQAMAVQKERYSWKYFAESLLRFLNSID